VSGMQKHQGQATDFLLSDGNLQKELEQDVEEVHMRTGYVKVPIGGPRRALTGRPGVTPFRNDESDGDIHLS